MFLIRQSRPEDVSSLAKLARMVHFINLPPNDQIIAGKIAHSARCFRSLVDKAPGAAPAKSKDKRGHAQGGGWSSIEHESDLFMFTIVSPDTGAAVGTSQIRAHQGGPGNPNWTMRVTQKSFHSPQLGFGTTHTVGQLFGDESGPSELGGLIIEPSLRGHRLRPGRLLSFVRFHLVGLHRAVFAERLLAEMMGVVSNDGDNPFWDAFGRKFVPVKYSEADRFCQYNRSFISELLPKEEIYLTLLPLEVVNTLGVVPRETIPARRLLESLGFKNRGFIDPFDAGPHLDAMCEDVPLVKATRTARVEAVLGQDTGNTSAIVSTLSREGEFRAVEAWCEIDKQGGLRIPAQAAELLRCQAGSTVGLTPLGKFGMRREADDAGAKLPSAKRAGSAGRKAASAGTPAKASRKRASV